jgi:hypothetical protein
MNRAMYAAASGMAERASWGDCDVAISSEFIGDSGGLVRPYRVVLVSQKVRRAIEQEKLRGVTLEVAHLV